MIVFSAICIIGALLVVILMMFTTPRASVRAASHDPQAMWGMLRRVFYLSIAGGNMGMGLWTAWGWTQLSPAMMTFWLMISVPIGLFLVLKAAGFIDQDYWIGSARPRQRPSSVSEVAVELRGIVMSIQNPARRRDALRAVNDLDRVAS